MGCDKKASFEKDQFNNIVIKSKHVFIERVDVEKWKVGPLKRQEVSKGIRVGIKFPILSKSELTTLTEEKKVDSWLVRVKRRGNLGSSTLGNFYVPLLHKGSGGSSLRVKIIKRGYFYVYYAAAAMSKRFEFLNCPAFGHDKVLDGIRLSPHLKQEKKFSVSGSSLGSIASKIEKFGYQQMIFNGGSDITGDYFVEMSLFNFKKKERKTSWIKLSEKVTVANEKTSPIKGCSGATIPPPPRNTGDPFKKFKFGR